MEMKLDAEVMKDVVSSAILKSLDDEQRNHLIQGAITHLLTPQSTGNYYGNKNVSPLTDAFNHAVEKVANKIATDMLENDPQVRLKIQELIVAAFDKVFNDNREQTVSKIADAVVKGMTGENRY